MCGIAGCVGHQPATEFVLEGLEALEYRGYDSAGIAYGQGDELEIAKAQGRLANLMGIVGESAADSTAAIGHTRWATHGEPSAVNAHPHGNELGTIAVVHNGIIENDSLLRDRLASEGYEFKSETDTEVIPHLLDFHLRETGDMGEAFELTVKELVGAYAILAYGSDTPETIYAARLSSPLVIGAGENKHFIASDASPISRHTKKTIYLEDDEIATITPDRCSIKNIGNGHDTSRDATELELEFETAELGDYPHFMLKEIHEAADTVRAATRGRINPDQNMVRLGGLESVRDKLDKIDRLTIVACGTSFYAGMVGKYLIEEVANLPVDIELASEFKDRQRPVSPNSAVLAISQSGETADTIAALDKVDSYGVLSLGIVNAPGSTIARMTDAGVYCHAGPELSVASTKAFVSQVTVLSELALRLCRSGNPQYEELVQELGALPDKIDQLLESSSEHIEELAKKYSGYKNFSFIGKGYNYPTALEGALKLKEVSYIHAEGYSAGELKHGPIALIDEDHPTVAIATDGKHLGKTISNIREIRARKGPVIAVATEGNKDIQEHCSDVIYLPPSMEHVQPILAGVALQLFAYHVAVKKGLNVDRPRNLAKSVTVE